MRLLACENDGRDYAEKSDFARILEFLKAEAFKRILEMFKNCPERFKGALNLTFRVFTKILETASIW